MGRPPAPWLARAYQVLADGRWHPWDEVIAEMVKTIPPGIARRRGAATHRNKRPVADAEYIRRGGRHIAAGSLNDSSYVEKRRVETGILLRLATSTGPLEELAHCPTCTCNVR